MKLYKSSDFVDACAKLTDNFLQKIYVPLKSPCVISEQCSLKIQLMLGIFFYYYFFNILFTCIIKFLNVILDLMIEQHVIVIFPSI